MPLIPPTGKIIIRGYITHPKGINDLHQIRSGSVENDASGGIQPDA